MKKIFITFITVFLIGSNVYAYMAFYNNGIIANSSKCSCETLLEATNIAPSNRAYQSNTSDVAALINRFLSESEHGKYGVSFDLFKDNNRLIYRGECESDYKCDFHFNYLYTGKLSVNGKSIGSYVGKINWNIILRGPHAGAFVLEVVSDDGSAGDLHIDNMRKAIAKSLSASLIKEYSSPSSHDYLYKNGKGFILFSYSWGASYFFFNLYASGDKSNLMNIISNH